jgi:sulfur carrier protein
MNVEVNGAQRQVTEGSTLADLVAELGYGSRMVVIERNGEPVERARFAEIVIEQDDVIEVVRAVAGG